MRPNIASSSAKFVSAAVVVTSLLSSSAMASGIPGETIVGVFSNVILAGTSFNNPAVGQTKAYDNSGTADYSIVNSTNPTLSGSPPLQSTGSALIWGDNNGGAGAPSTLDFFGAAVPSNLGSNFRLGRITYSNGTSSLASLIFGATISFYATSGSSSTYLGSDTIYISTTSNHGASTSQDSDYISICGNQSNICSSSINAVESSEGGTGVTVDLYGTIVGDPQLFINSAQLTPGQTSSMNGFIGSDLPAPIPLPASAPLFGAALAALGAIGAGLKRRKAAEPHNA